MRLNDRDAECLAEIVRQCRLISERLAMIDNDESRFKEESLYADGCAFCLLQIGEYANRLSDALRDDTPDVNWYRVIGMRNIIAHAYGSFDLDIAWETVTQDIPELERVCEELLA